MSKFRVTKIKNNSNDSIESTPFDNKKEAEQFAKTSSISDNEHFFVLEEKDEEFNDYDDIKYFVNGESADSSF